MPQLTATNELEQRCLHILFNRWVLNSEDFGQTTSTLKLSSEDIAAIKAEITFYRLNTALAKGKQTSYLALWETLDLLKETVKAQNMCLKEHAQAVQAAEKRF
jgi:hypothetical protein